CWTAETAPEAVAAINPRVLSDLRRLVTDFLGRDIWVPVSRKVSENPGACRQKEGSLRAKLQSVLGLVYKTMFNIVLTYVLG
ncbi:hypothetical protein E3A20_22060, partial [Planctomyces bekefii]